MKKSLALLAILAAVLIVTSMSPDRFLKSRTSAEFPQMAWAVTYPLEKKVGDFLYYKCRVKNTGTITWTFTIVADQCEHGTSFWYPAFETTVTLDPDQESGTIEVGNFQLSSNYAGHYYDVRFRLFKTASKYEHEMFDEKIIENALHVGQLTGSITDGWIE